MAQAAEATAWRRRRARRPCFKIKGKVAHPTDPTTGGYDSNGYSNWWTQASSKVKRSVIMDNFVFSVSDDLIKVNDLDALSTDLAAMPIGS